MSINRKIFWGLQNGAAYIAATILITLIQFRVVLEFLPRDLAGIWFIFLNIGTYVSFFDLGISPTLSREISFVLGQQIQKTAREKQIADLIATCGRIFKVSSLAVFFLTFLLGGTYLVKIAPERLASLLWAWLVFSMGASLNLLNSRWFASLNGMGDVATEKLIRTLTQILGLLLGISALYLGWGLFGLSLAWAIQGVIAGIISKHVFIQYYPFLKSSGTATMAMVRKIIHPSLKWATMAFGAILILQTDNIIIASTLGPKAIPSYEAIAKLTTVLMTLSMLFVQSSTPFLSRLYSAQEKDEFDRLMLRNTRYCMATMAVLASFLAVFGDHIISLWLGPGNFVGFPILWTFLLMLFLETHHVSLATGAMAAGHIIFARVAILAGILNIVLSLILVRYLGLWGVALGTLISQMLTNNWYVPFKTLKIFHISIKNYIQVIFAPIIGLETILLAFNIGTRHLATNLSEMTLIITSFSISVSVGIFIIVMVIMKYRKRDLIQNDILRNL